jgi:lipid A disaccharide synthetase
VRVAHIGLPNLILGRRAFPEILQSDVRGPTIARAVVDVLGEHALHRRSCRAVRDALRCSLDDRSPAERVAATLQAWLT